MPNIPALAIHRTAVLALIVLIGLAAGCKTQNSPPPPPPGADLPGPGINPAILDRMRAEPDLVFGSVVAVRPEDRLAAVEGIPAAEAHEGDSIIFVAGDQAMTINSGTILSIVNGRLHVRYEAPSTAQRDPLVGDVAAKWRKPK